MYLHFYVTERESTSKGAVWVFVYGKRLYNVHCTSVHQANHGKIAAKVPLANRYEWYNDVLQWDMDAITKYLTGLLCEWSEGSTNLRSSIPGIASPSQLDLLALLLLR